MWITCRGEGGELRLGIRRAARPKNGLPDRVNGNQSSNHNIFASVANAVFTKNVFQVFYSPRYCFFKHLSCDGGCRIINTSTLK